MNWFWKKPPIPHFVIKDTESNVIFVAPRPDLWMQDFHGVIWHNAVLHRVDMGGSNFEGADLTGSKMIGARFCNANLRHANLTYCDLTDVDFRGADLTGADLFGSELGTNNYRCNFEGCKGLDKAFISPYETCAYTKPTKTKAPSRAELARIPARPRALLVLGEIGFRNHKYQGPERSAKKGRPRRTWSQRRNVSFVAPAESKNGICYE